MLVLPTSLRREDDATAVAQLRQYFGVHDPATAFTGAMFDEWDTTGTRLENVDRFTADDFLSLACLSERFLAPALRAVLVDRAVEFNTLLARIPTDVDMTDVNEPWAPEHPAWQLHSALLALPDVGRTRASKIMARKRPRLIPVYDSFVAHEMGIGRQHWEPLRLMLRETALGKRLQTIKAASDIPEAVSLLRVLDVIAWKDRWDALRGLRAHKG